MNYDNIPSELKDLDRWVVWREGKIPYDAKYVNSRASSTNPDTWASFDQATTAYEECDQALGVGFVLNGDGLCGIDIDHCIHDAEIDPAALQLLDHLGTSYISISPSGTGLRAFGYATPLLQGVKGTYEGLAVELYSNQRYLTITDHLVKMEPLVQLQHFDSLAHYIRSSSHVDTATGEIVDRQPHERHTELVKRILKGDVYHDSLRDLAASLCASGAHNGAVVNHLKALMQASNAEHDQRWQDRYKQIPALVRSAAQKYVTFDPFAPAPVKEDEDIFDSMSAVFADNLPTEFEAPNEIIEDFLTARSTALLFGDSNVGKSFLAISMACAVSQGTDFLGKRTQPGLTIYLASESPESIRMRLQAYMRYHQCLLPNLLVIQKPIDLYNSEEDSEKIIEIIKRVEEQREMKASLIVADTLARMMAGGDENSITAMQPVLNRMDRIMNSTLATVLLVHHTAKGASVARGHSSLRAHVDSEIGVFEEDGIRKMLISKQRSLASKNQELPFNLLPIHMGYSVFGKPLSTCVTVQ
jgi:AAA domain